MWVEPYIAKHSYIDYISNHGDGVAPKSHSLLKWNLIEMATREPCDYTFLVVGSVGAGKSTFCNFISKDTVSCKSLLYLKFQLRSLQIK